MNNTVSLLSLPNEILYQITRYLKLGDLISLSQTCNHLKTVCSLQKMLDCCEQFDVKPGTLNSFLKTCINPAFVTVCNFNHCYWIPANILKSALPKFTNLEVLHVAETRLKCQSICQILVKCCKIRCLSLTISSVRHFWITDPHELVTPISVPASKQMKRVEQLHVYGVHHLDSIASLISMCPNLEELCLVLTFHGRIWNSVVSNYVPIRIPKLHSVVFHSTPLYGPFVKELMNALSEVLFPELHKLKVCWFHIPEPRDMDQPEQWEKSSGIQAFQYPHDETLDFSVETGTLKSLAITCYDILPHGVSSLKHLKVLGPAPDKGQNEELTAFVSSNPDIEILDLQMGILCNFAHKLPGLSVLNIVESPITGDFFSVLATNCPVLEDLSLGNPFMERRKNRFNEMDLMNISKMSHLKRLSLRGLQVKSGNFIGLILQHCDRLESLMLENIGPSGLCYYTNQLTENLAKATKLKHLLIRQSNVMPLRKLLNSVQKCKSLQQLGLLLPSSTDPLNTTLNAFLSRMKKFVKELPRLVALNCLFSVPRIQKAARRLSQIFREERPAFIVVMKNVESPRRKNFGDLPVIHKKVANYVESPRIASPFGQSLL